MFCRKIGAEQFMSRLDLILVHQIYIIHIIGQPLLLQGSFVYLIKLILGVICSLVYRFSGAHLVHFDCTQKMKHMLRTKQNFILAPEVVHV